MENNRL